MSNAIYPTLPGLGFGTVRAVIPPPVLVRTTPARREYRARDALLNRYAYTLTYNFLRASAARLELQTLAGFYSARGGPFDTFLFKDVDDCTATAQVLGTGDGTTATWQALRSFGGFAEAVDAFDGNPLVYLNGTLQTLTTHYTLPGNGRITFTTVPTVGAALTWSGAYLRRVRFDGDKLETTRFLHQLYEAKRVQLISSTT